MDIFRITVPYIPRTNMPKRTGVMYIYTDNRQHVELFIQQHGITIYDVEVVTDTTNFQGENWIIPCHLYSNTEHKIFTIMTTPRLIKNSKFHVGTRLGDALTFGDLILREDIPIVEIIFKLIELLPYTAIQEYADVDEENCTDFQLFYKLNTFNSIKHPSLEGCETIEEFFYEYLYNLLDCYADTVDNSKPQPITLEGYVEYISTLSIK